MDIIPRLWSCVISTVIHVVKYTLELFYFEWCCRENYDELYDVVLACWKDHHTCLSPVYVVF